MVYRENDRYSKIQNPVYVSYCNLKKYTSIMMQSLVEVLVELLNYFLSNNRVSGTMIPSMIV